jgi:hypothetical protein
MKCAVEMGSSALIYIPSFTKIGSAIQKLKGGGRYTCRHTYSHTQTARWSHKPTFIFSNKESRLSKLNFFYILYKNSVCITGNTLRLRCKDQTNVDYCENHTKHMNTVCTICRLNQWYT